MAAKDKALELYNQYLELGKDHTRGVSMKEFAKDCALIAVNEILRVLGNTYFLGQTVQFSAKYWQEVKEEINKL